MVPALHSSRVKDEPEEQAEAEDETMYARADI